MTRIAFTAVCWCLLALATSSRAVAPDPNEGFNGISLFGEGDDERLRGLIQKSPKATKARIGWPEMGDSALVELARVSGLEEVEIQRVTRYQNGLVVRPLVSEKGWAALAALPKLRRLVVSGVPINEETCRGIAKLATVTELDLANCDLDDRAVLRLAGMTQLTRFEVCQKDLSATELMKVVVKFRRLEHLALPYTLVGDRDMKAVADLPRLKTLVISNTRVADEGAIVLATSPTLMSVTIHYKAIKNAPTTTCLIKERKSSTFLQYVGEGSISVPFGAPPGTFGNP